MKDKFFKDLKQGLEEIIIYKKTKAFFDDESNIDPRFELQPQEEIVEERKQRNQWYKAKQKELAKEIKKEKINGTFKSN
jgi:hypothetical protein